MRRAAPANAAAVSPFLRETWADGASSPSRTTFSIAALEMARLPPSSHAMRSASDARLACHQDSATTATASGMRTMRRTPFIAAIEVSLTDFSAPPNTGQWMTAAYSMSGGRTSMAKTGCPVTLSHRARRPRGRPGDLPITRIFQRDVGRRLDLGGAVGDGAEGHAAAARGVGDDAIARAALRCRDVPEQCRGGDQHFARGRAGTPHIK